MSKTSTTMIQNPPMVFKMPLVKDQFGVLVGVGGGSQASRSAGPASLFTVSRAPPKRKESFKTQRQLKEEEEKKALLKLKIRCKIGNA